MTLYYTRNQITLPDKRIIEAGKVFGDRDVPEEMIQDMLKTNVIVAVKDRDIPLEHKDDESPEASEDEGEDGDSNGEDGEADDEGDEEPGEQNGTKKPSHEVKTKAKKRRRR